MAVAARQLGQNPFAMSSIKFSSVASEMCAWAFTEQIKELNKEFTDKELYKRAKFFFYLLTVKKGTDECPFPEYLVKYYKENRFLCRH